MRRPPESTSLRRLAGIALLALLFAGLGCGDRKLAEVDRSPLADAAALLQAEDRRDPGPARARLHSAEAQVRARAAVALGRIRDAADVPLLSDLLQDPESTVRAAAAFALGLLQDEGGVPGLIAALDDASAEVRAQAARAMTRQPGAGEHAGLLLPILRSRDPVATPAVLYGLWRLQSEAVIDEVLALTAAGEGELRSAAAYCLMRMLSAAAVGATPVPGGTALDAAARGRAVAALRRLARDDDERIRELAARALGGPDLPGAVDLLLGLLEDPVWRVRVNALRSLGNAGDFPAADLLPALQDENPNVQLAALAALASLPAGGPAADVVRELLARPEAPFRAAAAAALAAWEGDSFLPTVRAMAAAEEPAIRAAAAGILGPIQNADAAALLTELRRDAEPQVQAAALTALAARPDMEARALGLEGLQAVDFTVRSAAVGLFPVDDTLPLEALASGWEAAFEDPQNDVRMAIARAAGAAPPGGRADDLLERMLRDDPDWRIRVEAAAMLRRRGIDAAAGPLATGRELSYYEGVLLDADRPHRAVVETQRGRIVLELFAADAPLTVRNFEELARSGYFDGLTLHRVVPNFVIQGGDPRGDGWGGPGHQIRCEINGRLYGRGTLGMALDGYDTGGSQIFVTHTPQPHLDGGYTVFGQVLEGMEIVDSALQGDRILSVSIEWGSS